MDYDAHWVHDHSSICFFHLFGWYCIVQWGLLFLFVCIALGGSFLLFIGGGVFYY